MLCDEAILQMVATINRSGILHCSCMVPLMLRNLSCNDLVKGVAIAKRILVEHCFSRRLYGIMPLDYVEKSNEMED